MEKRVLLAVVLSFVVLYGYQALFPPPPLPTVPAVEPVPAAPTAAAGGAQEPPLEAEPKPAPSGAEPVTAAASEQDIVVESEAVRAVFTTRGGALKSWRLKHYTNGSGEPLELVPPMAPPGSIRPFTLDAEDPAVGRTLRTALYRPGAEHVRVGPGGASLTFEYQDASGLSAQKQFTFSDEQPYVIEFAARVERNGTAINPTIHWGPALGNGTGGGGMMYNPPPQPLFYRDGESTRLSFDDLPEDGVQEGAFEFVGVDDHYFLSAALDARPARVEYDGVRVPRPDENPFQFISWSIRYPDPPSGARFFFGPKDFEELKALGPEFTHAIDFGMFRWLVVPLLNALKWVNGYLGNYGWSIIALTVIINLVMFPLRHKSVVSMRRMQELQPEVKAIQERYAKLKISDPARQKMNQEMMNLYRERGVNPASGCVPMLLTFPVLFAFYSMLSVAIEIRGAPFVGWIDDLSASDPYFIWPVVMGISMVVQQRMTPQTMTDPMQQKMMMMMPVVFSVMLAWAPSGLVLYWTASNLWTIGQQAVTNKIIGPPPQHAVRPPAERRLKTAGAGKTQQAARERK